VFLFFIIITQKQSKVQPLSSLNSVQYQEMSFQGFVIHGPEEAQAGGADLRQVVFRGAYDIGEPLANGQQALLQSSPCGEVLMSIQIPPSTR
jgi:hypothetical protein